MKKRLNNFSLLFKKYILLLSSIFIILPFLYVSFYIHPYGDDFTFNYMTHDLGFIEAQKYWYSHGNGRYFSSLILSIPVISEFPFYIYKLIPIMLIFLTIISTMYFLKSISIDVTNRNKRLISLTIFALYLFNMPSVKEGFYWAASSITYQLSLILSLLFLSFWINCLKYQSGYFLALTIVTFVSIFGSNETNFIITYLVMFSAIVIDFIKTKKISTLNIILLLIGLLLIILSVKAPGNNVRIDNLETSMNFNDSILLTVSKLIQLSLSFLPLLVITIYIFYRLGIKIKLKPNIKLPEFLNPWNTTLLAIVILCAGIFPSFYILGRPPNRVLNIICFYFILYFFYIVCNLKFSKIPMKIKALLKQEIMVVVVVFIVIFKFYKLNNVKTAYAEIWQGKIANYDRELKERYNILKLSECETCYVPKLKSKPRTIFFNDIAEFNNNWRNAHYADQFGKMQILVK